jgi:hypothetical protein
MGKNKRLEYLLKKMGVAKGKIKMEVMRLAPRIYLSLHKALA